MGSSRRNRRQRLLLLLVLLLLLLLLLLLVLLVLLLLLKLKKLKLPPGGLHQHLFLLVEKPCAIWKARLLFPCTASRQLRVQAKSMVC